MCVKIAIGYMRVVCDSCKSAMKLFVYLLYVWKRTHISIACFGNTLVKGKCMVSHRLSCMFNVYGLMFCNYSHGHAMFYLLGMSNYSFLHSYSCVANITFLFEIYYSSHQITFVTKISVSCNLCWNVVELCNKVFVA